ncbi:hypothetical protein ERJ75_000348700 [Trypanosoma vivax]|nr:hypothetical protein TRVL_00871 [Trypanosoma vivax]KAH8617589.1 hypothetical protein ERJ75_000348700 [Trypanosoma vivax]
MPARRRQQSLRRGETAVETMAALDAMEENLRMLGLIGESELPNSAPAKIRDTQEYLAEIKKTKEDAIKLRHEKEYRQFLAEEQKRENEILLNAANKERALQSVIKEAYRLLEDDTQAAKEAMSRNICKSSDRLVGAREFRFRENLRGEAGPCPHAATSWTSGDAEKCESKNNRKLLKSAAAREYCHAIIAGVVELAIRVADNMYSNTVFNGIPMRRAPQDLSVSAWRAWVEELVFSKTICRPISEVLATTSMQELRCSGYRSLKNLRSGPPFEELANTGDAAARDVSDSAGSEVPCENYGETAENMMKRISELRQKCRSKVIGNSVYEAIMMIKGEEKKKLRAELHEVRQQHDSESAEEVLPGWTHRLPPVGCFLFGDELSGLKATAEVPSSDAFQDVPLTQSRRRGSFLHLAEIAKNAHEWDASGDDGIAHRVLTPSQLTRAPQGFQGQGGGGSGIPTGGSVKHARGQNASATLSARGKEARPAEDVAESKQYIDALCEALTKELAAVYQYNLQCAIRPMHAVNGSESDSPTVQRMLFLVGFPETEAFWRTLCQKLNTAVEIVEQEVTRVLKEDDTTDELHSGLVWGKPSSKQMLRAGSPVARGKGGGRSAGLPQSKKSISSKLPATDLDETILQRVRVYPPLCLLGVFLRYDVPSRYRRMRCVRNRHIQSLIEASGPRTGSPHYSVAGSTSAMGADEENSMLSEWPMQKLRLELIHQDRHMRRCCKIWCSHIAKATMTHAPECDKVQVTEKTKKRVRSVTTPNRGNEQSLTGAGAVLGHLGASMPKVLYFVRKEVIPEQLEQENPLMYFIHAIKRAMKAPHSSLTTNQSLVPGQLVAPLKMSDYRFPSSTLTQLVELNNRFCAHWNEMSPSNVRRSKRVSVFRSLTLSTLQSPSQQGRSDQLTWDDSVRLEAEMYRVYNLFASDLLHFMTHDVFPPSLWSKPSEVADCNSTSGNNQEALSRTAHFMRLDENYNISCESLRSLVEDGMTKLGVTGSLLLCSVMNAALVEVGEALGKLCAWVRSSVGRPVPASVDAEKSVQGESTSPLALTSGGLVPADQKSFCDFVQHTFLSSVPRLKFEEVEQIVKQLDGDSESFDVLKRFIWSYALRVQETAQHSFYTSTQCHNNEGGGNTFEFWRGIAPRVMRIVLSPLFAFSEVMAMDETDSGMNADVDCTAAHNGTPETACEGDSVCANAPEALSKASISVSIGRVMAAIRLLHKSCIVAAMCTARWVDSIYVRALVIPPNGEFPQEHRPSDISSIFRPPEIVVKMGRSQPPSLALQMLRRIVPSYNLAPENERDCWKETELELVLQSFSIHLKDVVDQEEFIHSLLQLQLKCLWKLLPSKLHAIAAEHGITLPFPLRDERNDERAVATIPDTFVNILANKPCTGYVKTPILAEEECGKIFACAVTQQKQDLLDSTHVTKGKQKTLTIIVSSNNVEERQSQKRQLRLQEFLVNLIFCRPCCNEIGQDNFFNSTYTVREPSTIELREMVRSFPRVLREQGPGSVDSDTPINMDVWRRIKWWRFYDDSSMLSATPFIQHYLLRVLTVSFEIDNGELCVRNTPFLPDLLSAVVRTRGSQATMERYYHALVALNASRENKFRHSDGKSMPQSFSELVNDVGYVRKSSTGGEEPLSAFELQLSVEEALFFFQRQGKRVFSNPTSRDVLGQTSPVTEPAEEWEHYKHRVDEDNEEENTLSLELELILLLEVEDSIALSLTLFGSSHWGRYIMPRLTAV